jgi:pimeloyl-ACP methyl ester carboxylesterase
MAKMVWDGSRAVDVLASRPEVDPARLGCLGHSLGGKEALFLAAFDERVKATVASDGGIGLAFSNWQDVWYLGPEVRRPEAGLDNHQVLALVAPRAFLLVGGEYDNDRAWPFIASVLPLWQELGAPAAVGWFRHGAGHRWPVEAQRVGYEFLDQHLIGSTP